MRIGIISDTHDKAGRTERAIDRLQSEGVAGLIHCGDYTSPEIVHICGVIPNSYYVFGNNDFDEIGLRIAITAVGGVCLEFGGELVLAGKRIAVTHGDIPREFRRLLAGAPDYLLYGHTHIPLNEHDGATRQINPGALHRAAQWTVAVLDVVQDQLRFLKID
jgi:putative phosphoesterase